MRAITHAILARAGAPPGPILELGCGAGVFNAALAEQRKEQGPVWGADLHPLALAYARRVVAQPPKLLQANLQNLPIPDDTLSAIVALDVFDQKGVDMEDALAESRRVLRQDGKLLLRVSAYSWLEGEHDKAFNTGQRYDRYDLASQLSGQHLEIERLTHANTLLAPPVIVLRLLQRWGWLAVGETVYQDSLVNRLFAKTLQLEANLLATFDLPFGISLYAIATKTG